MEAQQQAQDTRMGDSIRELARKQVESIQATMRDLEQDYNATMRRLTESFENKRDELKKHAQYIVEISEKQAIAIDEYHQALKDTVIKADAVYPLPEPPVDFVPEKHRLSLRERARQQRDEEPKMPGKLSTFLAGKAAMFGMVFLSVAVHSVLLSMLFST